MDMRFPSRHLARSWRMAAAALVSAAWTWAAPAQAQQLNNSLGDACMQAGGYISSCSSGNVGLFTFTYWGGIIENRTGKCLDVKHYGTSDYTDVQLFDCNGGTNQKWTYLGKIENELGCLDVQGGSWWPGQPVWIWPCGETDNNAQVWDHDPVTGLVRGPYAAQEFTPSNTTCLTHGKPGEPVFLSVCGKHDGQRWTPSESGGFRSTQYPGSCLGVVQGDDRQYGATVRLAPCRNGDRQEWAFDGLIRSKLSGKCLTGEPSWPDIRTCPSMASPWSAQWWTLPILLR